MFPKGPEKKINQSATKHFQKGKKSELPFPLFFGKQGFFLALF